MKLRGGTLASIVQPKVILLLLLWGLVVILSEEVILIRLLLFHVVLSYGFCERIVIVNGRNLLATKLIVLNSSCSELI